MVKRLSNTNQNSTRIENVPEPVNAGDAVNKAYIDALDFVKSSTTDRITVSATAPTSPTAGDIWIDTTELPENLAPSTIIWKETPTGAVDNANRTYQTVNPYVSGTLQVFINGVAQSNFISETGPGNGVFDLDIAPLSGDNIKVQYQVRPSASTGDAASISGVSLSALLGAIYPIGSVFVSASSTMPPIIAGVGTWARLNGRVIVGVSESETEFNTVNKLGGHKLMQAHNHTLNAAGVASGAGGYPDANGFVVGSAGADRQGGQRGVGNTGGGDAQNLQPYKTKYMWERTA